MLRISGDGRETEVFTSAVKMWGQYLRYNYATFDFSSVRESGLYVLEYGTERTPALRIAGDVYANAWQPTLDVLPRCKWIT